MDMTLSLATHHNLKVYLLFILSLCSNHCLATQEGLSFTLGGFYSKSDSGMEVTNPQTGKAFNLDFETDLQLVTDDFLPYFELVYWFNERHELYFDWKKLDRKVNNKLITSPYQYENIDTGQTYQVQAGADISTSFNVELARVGYGYAFHTRDNVDLIVTLGLHVMWIKLAFEGELGACLDDDCNAVEIGADNTILTEVTAPLPDIGLEARYRFAKQWELLLLSQYFVVTIDDTNGQLVDLSAGLGYSFTPDFALKLSYKYYRIDVEIEDKLSVLDLYYGFNGPMLALSYHF